MAVAEWREPRAQILPESDFTSDNTADAGWRAKIVRKIEELITDENELAEIIFYLSEQADKNRGYQNSEKWLMLKDFLHSDKVFSALLKKILREIEMNRQQVRDSMKKIYDRMNVKETSSGRPIWHLDPEDLAANGFFGFAHAWTCLSPETQAKILAALPTLVGAAFTELAKKASTVINTLGKQASTVLAAVYLTYEALRYIYLWWIGEITGSSAAIKIMESIVAIAAGIAGGIGGAAVGALAGPVGIVIGAIIGSWLTSTTASILVKSLTEEIFGFSQDEALEKAYKFLGVRRKSNIREINQAFHALCLKHHPDKGGSHEMFLKLQTNMAIVKVSRGETYS